MKKDPVCGKREASAVSVRNKASAGTVVPDGEVDAAAGRQMAKRSSSRQVCKVGPNVVHVTTGELQCLELQGLGVSPFIQYCGN